MPLAGRRDHDVAILSRAMIALGIDWPRRALVAVDCAAGDAGNLPIADDLLAVGDDGHHPPDQSDVVGLPLSGRSGSDFSWRNESVDTAEAMRIWLATVIVFDLDFVAAAQIDSAVAAGGITEFDVKLEIAEGAHGTKVDAGARAGEHAIAHEPLVGRSHRLPAVEIVGIEQPHRGRPRRRTGTSESWCAHALPIESGVIGESHPSDEAVALQTESDAQIPVAVFPLMRHGESQ